MIAFRDRWRPRAARLLLALLSALLYWLAVAHGSWWWLAFVLWVPWLLMLDDLDPGPAFLYGLASGFAAVHLSHLWMIQPLLRHAFPVFHPDGGEAFGTSSVAWSNLTLGAFSLGQGCAWGVCAGAIAWLRRRTAASVLWLAPATWVAIDAFFPQTFPIALALPLAGQPLWIQTAELGGPATVAFGMLAVNAGLYELTRIGIRERRLDRRTMVFLAAWLVGLPAYGAVRMAMVDAAVRSSDSVRFGLVQGNFGIETGRAQRGRILRELQRQTAELEREGAQVAVWGETAFPYSGFYRDSTRDFSAGVRRVRRQFTLPLVFGARVHEFDAGPDAAPWSSAWVLNSDASLGDRYDKGHPLPLIESRSRWRGELANPHHVQTGDGARVLAVGGWRLGASIGHEDMLRRHVRATAGEGVHALVSLVNESWFGRGAAQSEHLGLATFRAVEHRRALLRVVDAGISAYIDPTGRIVKATQVTDADADGYARAEGFVADVPMIDPGSRSVYGRIGDPLNLLVIAPIGVLAWRRRRRR